jgi:alpha-L-arabinofuranosidase
VHHVADLGPFSLLDASATWNPATGQLTLAVVNRDRERSHAATIDLGGATMTGGLLVSEVNGPAVDAINSFERPDVVGVQERRREGGAATLEYDFPAHSLSVLRMQVR